LLTRDSEPRRIARIEFKKKKKTLWIIEWQDKKKSVRDCTSYSAN